MADDTDPWTQRFQNIDKLMTQPSAPAPTSGPATAPPASTPSVAPPADGLVRDVGNAFVGGIYDVGANIARNLGVTPNQLPPEMQTAMAAHPYFAGAGNLVGGTAVALPVALGAEVAAPLVGIGTGFGGSVLTGAATGAAQNALTGSPDEPWYQRAGTGAVLGGVLGGIANRVGGWFGAGRSIPQDTADAAKIAQSEGVTNLTPSNLPGAQATANIKAMGATPTFEQSGQIDNAVSKILGENVPDFKPANLNTVKNSIGGDVTKAAQSGQINAQPGGAFDQALTQVQQFANANGAGGNINPLVNQIRARIKNGVISGQDFDNLVGAGSPLHDLTGDDNPFVKQAAQALDKVMDSGFQASSPQGAYDAWVDARTRYRLLMGVQKALLPSGHVNPTTLFNSIQNRFTDLKGTPLTNDPLVGRMGQFADSIRTLFGGGVAPPQAGPGLLRTLGVGSAGGGAAALVPEIMSGNALNPENYLTPAALTAGGVGAATMLGRYLGQAYQQSPRFVNALINAGGAPIANPLMPYAPAIGTQIFPQRHTQ
jgi:hypothetical protein